MKKSYFINVPLTTSFIVVGALVTATIFILHQMGRLWYCACGYIKFWHGAIWSSENSQHIADWYTFSHLIHGFIFYWLLQKFLPKTSIGLRMVLAILVEVSWEILENSSFIIDRYRESTVSLDYYGDSIVNAFSDIIACLIGFWLARKLPVWLSLTLVIIFEIVVGYIIRDNLALNIIMLVHPLESIKTWQLGLSGV